MESRKLGYWETIQALKHDYFHGTGIAVSVNGIKGQIDHNILKKILHRLYQNIPF